MDKMAKNIGLTLNIKKKLKAPSKNKKYSIF